MKISIFRQCSQIKTSSVQMSTELKLHQFVVPENTSIQWSFPTNDHTAFADMQFENGKKSTYPILEISILRPCSQVMASDVGMSMEADTPPVCSTREYFNAVEFFQKWPERLGGYAFWKLQ